jgi:hypothetical protein
VIDIEDGRQIKDRPDQEREEIAAAIVEELDRPMAALGIVFLLLVLAETLIDPQGAIGTTFQVVT